MASNLAITGIYEYIRDSANFATRAVTDSTTGGAGSGSFPASNIFDPNIGKYYQRTGLNSATPEGVTLDVELVGASGAPVGLQFAIAALLNVQAFFESNGQAVAVNVRVRASNTSFTTGYLTGFDYTHSVYPDPGLPKNAWFLPSYSPGVAAADLTLPSTQQYGGSSAPRYWRFEINLQAASAGLYTIRVGRVAAWLGLFAKAELAWGYDGVDDSNIIRAFNGTPFALRRSPRRRVSARLNALTDAQVFGESVYLGTANGMQIPNLAVANALSGITREIAIIPRMDQSQAAITGVKYPTIWQSMPFFGLMTQPFRARLEDKLSTAANFWTADFQADEIVP